MTEAVSSGRSRKRRAPNAAPARRVRPPRAVARNSDLVYEDLRRDIVALRRPPGSLISEKDLAETHGVSRTPVHEAVLRLTEERLIEVVPKSGTFVARIPLSSLPEALVARNALEGVTVRAASDTATARDMAELRNLVQVQREAAARADEDGFHEADEAFHAAIAAIGGYPGIWRFIQQMKAQVDRYRRLTLPQPGRMLLLVGEHLDIVDAIAAGEGEVAARRMTEHLYKLQIDIAVFRDMWPDYFIHDLPHQEVALTRRPGAAAGGS